jgi:hypothetical protein
MDPAFAGNGKEESLATTPSLIQIYLANALVHNEAMQVNIGEAKTHLSRLLKRVAAGEEVIIAGPVFPSQSS